MDSKKIRDRKVAQVFLEMSPPTWKRFGEFLQSPYFSIPASVHEFWTGLESHFLKGKTDLSEEEFFQFWRENASFDSDLLSQGFFRLGDALNRFLAIERFQSDPDFVEQLALEEMLHKNLDEHYARKSKRFSRSLFAHESGSWENTLLRLRHLLHHASFLLRNDREPEAKANLEGLLQSLEGFSELTKTMVVSSLLNGAFMTGEAVQDKWLDNLSDLPGRESPLLHYYRHVIRLQLAELRGEMAEALAAYFDLKAWLQANSGALGQEEQVDAFTHALNFCIRRSNVGHEAFPATDEILAWYSQLMARSLDQARINWGDYLNYGTILAKNGDLKRMERLIREGEGKVQGQFGEAVRTYLIGLLHYHKGKYKEARRRFWQVMDAPQQPQISAVNRTMLLRTLYELKEYADIAPQTESFRQYLSRAGKRKLISLKRKEAYKDFGRLLVKLTLLSTAPAPQPNKVEALENEIRSSDVVSKDWLLEKLAELS